MKENTFECYRVKEINPNRIIKEINKIESLLVRLASAVDFYKCNMSNISKDEADLFKKEIQNCMMNIEEFKFYG